MSGTDYPPRCKDKKNLANDVHCELYFLQKYAKNLDCIIRLKTNSVEYVIITSKKIFFAFLDNGIGSRQLKSDSIKCFHLCYLVIMRSLDSANLFLFCV